MCSVMAHAAYIREKARSLRIERRLTIDQLAERLALSRSTIYHWVRDLPIPGSGPGGEFPASARRKGNRAMQRKYRRLREEAYREGWERFDELAFGPELSRLRVHVHRGGLQALAATPFRSATPIQ